MRAHSPADRRSGSGHDKWYGMGRIGVNAAARMGYGVAIARLAGEDAFALYVGLTTIEVLVSTLLGAGWITPLGNLAPRLPAAERADFVRSVVARTLRAVAWIGVALVSASPLAIAIGDVPRWTYLLFCGATTAWLASSACGAALATRFESRRALIGQSLGHCGAVLGVATAALADLDPLACFFAGATIGHGAGAARMTAWLPGRRDALGREQWGEVARHGHVVIGGSIANSLCTRIQPFVLAAVGGAPAIAAFGAANTLVGPVRVFSGAIGEVLRPRLALHQGAAGDPARGRRALRIALIALVAVGAGMLAAFVVAGDWVADQVFGSQFAGLGPVLPWAALFVVVAAVVHVLVVAMQTHSLAGTSSATRARIVAAVVSLALVWPACAADGARGAFVAMTVAELLFLLVAVRFLSDARRTDVVAAENAAVVT